METWQALLVALLTPTVPGGAWAGIRWWTNRSERLAKEKSAREDAQQSRKEAHDNSILARFETMQARFLEALKERDTQEEKRRQEHLSDARFFVEKMAKAADALEALESRRPPAAKT